MDDSHIEDELEEVQNLFDRRPEEVETGLDVDQPIIHGFLPRYHQTDQPDTRSSRATDRRLDGGVGHGALPQRPCGITDNGTA
jgi:hypothetical protein